jgi:hypothetical protein
LLQTHFARAHIAIVAAIFRGDTTIIDRQHTAISVQAHGGKAGIGIGTTVGVLHTTFGNLGRNALVINTLALFAGHRQGGAIRVTNAASGLMPNLGALTQNTIYYRA